MDKDRAEVLKALADATRLQIFAFLMRRGDTCVCELAALLHTTAPNLSFHLGRLKAAHLVTDYKLGKWIFYKPDVAGVTALRDWLCPILDPEAVPATPADGSMAKVCCGGAVPAGRSGIHVKCCGDGVVVEVV